MAYDPKNYDHLKGGALKGLTDTQLDQHFTLYKGYIAKLNEIEEKLAAVDNTKPNYSFNEYSELKRREAVAFNGSFLHELYFENLGADTGNFEGSAEGYRGLFVHGLGRSRAGQHQAKCRDAEREHQRTDDAIGRISSKH